jgi:hypothetical protein
VVRDLISGTWRIETAASEWTVLPDGLAFGERGSQTFTITEGDPLSARIDREFEHELVRGDWRIRTRARTSLAATATVFVLGTELEALEGDDVVHRISRTTTYPRDGV